MPEILDRRQAALGLRAVPHAAPPGPGRAETRAPQAVRVLTTHPPWVVVGPRGQEVAHQALTELFARRVPGLDHRREETFRWRRCGLEQLLLRPVVVVDERGIDVGGTSHGADRRAGPAVLGERLPGAVQDPRGQLAAFAPRPGRYHGARGHLALRGGPSSRSRQFHHCVRLCRSRRAGGPAPDERTPVRERAEPGPGGGDRARSGLGRTPRRRAD